MSTIQITLAGCHQGQKKVGVDYGFTACMSAFGKLIREEKTNIIQNDFRNSDYFDDPIYGSYLMGQKILNNNTCNSEINSNELINVTFGGDHTISFGSIMATSQIHGIDNTYVLWIDAHPDINTPDSSLTGNCHGMPVAFLMGLAKHNKFNNIQYVKPSNFAYVGVRCFDQFEIDLIEELKKDGLTVFTPEEIKADLFGCCDKLKQKWNMNKDSKLHVSLDIDSLDPSIAPATGTPVNNGINIGDVCWLMSHLNGQKAPNFDVTEVNPQLSDVVGVAKTYYAVDRIVNHYVDICLASYKNK